MGRTETRTRWRLCLVAILVDMRMMTRGQELTSARTMVPLQPLTADTRLPLAMVVALVPALTSTRCWTLVPPSLRRHPRCG